MAHRFWTNIGLSLSLLFIPGCKSASADQSNLESRDDYPDCVSATQGQTCIAPIQGIHPTQFAIGYLDVQKKRKKIAKIKTDSSKLRKYLEENVLDAVKGPGGTVYVIDGHHRSRALAEEKVSTVLVKIMAQGDGEPQKFWKQMDQAKYVWPYDHHGKGPLDPQLIPKNILELKDDPYRSLAEDALKEEAYKEEKKVRYQQFYWANYYRKKITAQDLQSDYERALKKAVSLSQDPEARSLPGYIKN